MSWIQEPLDSSSPSSSSSEQPGTDVSDDSSISGDSSASPAPSEVSLNLDATPRVRKKRTRPAGLYGSHEHRRRLQALRTQRANAAKPSLELARARLAEKRQQDKEEEAKRNDARMTAPWKLQLVAVPSRCWTVNILPAVMTEPITRRLPLVKKIASTVCGSIPRLVQGTNSEAAKNGMRNTSLWTRKTMEWAASSWIAVRMAFASLARWFLKEIGDARILPGSMITSYSYDGSTFTVSNRKAAPKAGPNRETMQVKIFRMSLHIALIYSFTKSPSHTQVLIVPLVCPLQVLYNGKSHSIYHAIMHGLKEIPYWEALRLRFPRCVELSVSDIASCNLRCERAFFRDMCASARLHGPCYIHRLDTIYGHLIGVSRFFSGLIALAISLKSPGTASVWRDSIIETLQEKAELLVDTAPVPGRCNGYRRHLFDLCFVYVFLFFIYYYLLLCV